MSVALHSPTLNISILQLKLKKRSKTKKIWDGNEIEKKQVI
jgi:hypothetical protein